MFSGYWNGQLSTLNDDSNFEDLFAQAAQNFPLNDDKAEDIGAFTESALSPFASSSSSCSSSVRSRDLWSDSDSDSEIDDELLQELQQPVKDGDEDICEESLPIVEVNDSPFLPRSCHASITSDNRRPVSNEPLLPSIESESDVSRPPRVIHPPPRRTFYRSSGPSLASLSNEPNVGTDSDAGSESDDDYIPSPVSSSRKRARSPSPSLKPASLAILSGVRPAKRARLPPPSRNTQDISPSAIRAALAAAKNKVDLTCIACNWRQTNGRMPDFKRHLKTHLRPDDRDQTQGWWCKGVPLKDAAKYGVPKNSEPFMFANRWRVGGCSRTFSRRDALKRHLDNCNVSCIGKPCDASED